MEKSYGDSSFHISSPYFDRLNERLYFVTRNYDSNNDGSIDIKDDGHLWSADWVKDRLVNFSPVYFANREIISPSVVHGKLYLSERQGQFFDLYEYNLKNLHQKNDIIDAKSVRELSFTLTENIYLSETYDELTNYIRLYQSVYTKIQWNSFW